MDGTDFGLIAIGLLILLGCERYSAWRSFDRYRRLCRRAHINLMRGIR